MSGSSLLLNHFYTRLEMSLQPGTFIAVDAFQEDICAIRSLN